MDSIPYKSEILTSFEVFSNLAVVNRLQIGTLGASKHGQKMKNALFFELEKRNISVIHVT
jgi:hypothetical protein